MHTLKDEFSTIELAEPAHFRNLTLFPLLRPAPRTAEPEYVLADDALSLGLAKITELAGGSVPELQLENKAAVPVLLLDGEELIGAKQNRVLNLTILAPPRRTLVIPVSCVEAGRWSMHHPDFKPAPHMMYAAARALRGAQVSASMRDSGLRRSDQSAVWSDIAGKASRMQAASPTQAMSAIFERHSCSVEEFVHSFVWRERQAGVLFAIGGKPVGLDLFDHPSTLRRIFEKLIRSYALDALDSPDPECGSVTAPVTSRWLARLCEAPVFAADAVGLGKDVRIGAASVSGAALFAGGRYVHVCAFAARGYTPEARFGARLSRPSRRRA